ncbi:MAG: hypothetical protein AAF226_12500, partial [Verrucomicrobiota bacterium]
GITVSATGNVTLDHVNDPDGALGHNIADNSFTQIGLGGQDSDGAGRANIDVDAGGDIRLHGNNGNDAYSQIGNGGRQGNQAQADYTGWIDVDAGGNLIMRGGYNGENSYAKIGHGGRNNHSALDSGHNGDINVDVAGDIDMLTGALDRVGAATSLNVGSANYVQIGHGGFQTRSSSYGDIEVNSGGDLKIETLHGFLANNGSGTYSGTRTGEHNFGMIGHGGSQADEHRGQEIGIGQLGSANVTVSVDGDITLLSASSGGQADARITDQGGFVPISNSRQGFVQIGSGGRGNQGMDFDTSTISGDVVVNSGGDILMRGGTIASASNGAEAAGVSINYGQTAPRDNNVRIGLGGNNWRSNLDGDVDVAVAGDITIQAGLGAFNSAVIGNGGAEATFGQNAGDIGRTTRDGDINVKSGGTITAIGSDAPNSSGWGDEFSFAKIGNDGRRDAATQYSNITVSALDDVVLIAGTNQRSSYAQIGHGGTDRSRADITGTIDVTAGRTVSVTGDAARGVPSQATFAKIGHGHRVQGSQGGAGVDNAINGDISGDLFVKAGVNVELSDGFIGHEDSGANGASATYSSGNTYIAASRLNPDFKGGGTGDFIVDADSGFSSAGQGIFGELRLYMPNRPDNLIAAGATLNGSAYAGTPAGVADTQSVAGETFTLNLNPDE